MAGGFVSPIELRHEFAAAMSELYRREVPLYASLLKLVSKVNNDTLNKDPVLKKQLEQADSLARLNLERHGAIRLGSAEELVELTRFLRLLDMHPIGYYDLRAANLPIHATCFRSLTTSSLNISPFRLFVSLLRPELVPTDHDIQEIVQRSLPGRKLFSAEVTDLITLAESQGGLLQDEASKLIGLALPAFKFHGTSKLTLADYETLAASSTLLADIIAFPNPHINHLTPRTLDIDAVQGALLADPTFQAKQSGIEGPPPSSSPILLRQTSFCAVEESVLFSDGKIGNHTARFGEIEQRGSAVTPIGRAMYDRLLTQSPYRDHFLQIFGQSAPSTWEEMKASGWIWVSYRPAPGMEKKIATTTTTSTSITTTTPATEMMNLPTLQEAIDQLLAQEKIIFSPLTYEDFLPLSAAGIFQSNLGIENNTSNSYSTNDYNSNSSSNSNSGSSISSSSEFDDGSTHATPAASSEASSLPPSSSAQELASRKELEGILARAGATLSDEMEVYRQMQVESMRECVEYFGIQCRMTN